MIYLFTGYPLSGKSTFAKRWATYKDCGYFSSGRYAREHGMGEVQGDLSLAMNSRINTRVLKLVDIFDELVIDGWPRSVEQALLMDSVGKKYTTLFFTVNPLIARQRMLDRNREDDFIEEVENRTKAMVLLHTKLKDIMGHHIVTISGDTTTEEHVSWLEEFLVSL